VKREIPLLITAVIGLFMILSFFVPHEWVSVPSDFLQQSVIIVLAFSYFLGGANLLRVNFDVIYKRQPGWQYKVVLVLAMLATVLFGAIEGQGFLNPGTKSKWIYDNMYSPMQGTMFSLLAFFIASAAFRAFRIRTVEAGLLAIAALIVMLGRVPIGNLVTGWLPEPIRLQSVQEWIMNVPQNAAKRAILIGAALGVMATGLRVILGHRALLPERRGLSHGLDRGWNAGPPLDVPRHGTAGAGPFSSRSRLPLKVSAAGAELSRRDRRSQRLHRADVVRLRPGRKPELVPMNKTASASCCRRTARWW
jgi:hypothetical protein